VYLRTKKKIISYRLPAGTHGSPEIISMTKEITELLSTYTPQQKKELKNLVDLKTMVVKKMIQALHR
jgi:hypothetical protein